MTTLPPFFLRRWTLVSVLLLMSLLGLSACDQIKSGNTNPQKVTFHGVDITDAPYAQGFSLPDTKGQLRELAQFKGKVVVVFFGFTHCPDVCPTTLGELAHAKKLLGQEGEKLQAIFVTLDPQRDTADRLTTYVQAFDPSFIALRGDEAQIQETAKNFHIFYEKVNVNADATQGGASQPQDGSAGSSAKHANDPLDDHADGDRKDYTIDHTAGAYVFDPQGKIRLFERYGVGGKVLSEDIKLLLQGR